MILGESLLERTTDTAAEQLANKINGTNGGTKGGGRWNTLFRPLFQMLFHNTLAFLRLSRVLFRLLFVPCSAGKGRVPLFHS